LTGVPKGEEDNTERNLDVFYIRSLKAIGYGDLLPYPSPTSSAHPSRPGPPRPVPVTGWLNMVAANVLPVLVSVALVAGLTMAILAGPTGTG
jgi:hypothetical protein